MATFYKPDNQKKLLGKTLKLTISRYDQNGSGVGQYQKRSIFVEQALVGEVVNVKITEQNSKFIKAKLLNVISSNEQREQPPCRHFSLCGGCDLQHMSAELQLSVKKEKLVTLFQRAGITTELPWCAPITKQAFGYRRKVRIGVQYNKVGQAIVGFRQKASNNLVQIKHCNVMETQISDLFSPLKKHIDSLTQQQSIGHIEAIVANKCVLVLRQLIPLNNTDKAKWLAFAQSHHLEIVIDTGKAQFVLNNDNQETVSQPLHYDLADKSKIYFGYQDFIQVNHSVNQAMVSQAIHWLALNGNEQVLDLFCGLGNFTLPMAKHSANVIGIEGVQAMVDKAKFNAKQNQLDNCQFFQADLNANWQHHAWYQQIQQGIDIVLLDPARAGAEQAVKQLVKFKAGKVLYVSCEPASLARDAAIMLAHGYMVEKISLMDMFSQTKHIETMVLFTLAS